MNIYLNGFIYEGLSPIVPLSSAIPLSEEVKDYPHIPVPTPHNFTEGQEVAFGVNYKYGYQRLICGNWIEISESDYDSNHNEARIVALPLPQPVQEEKPKVVCFCGSTRFAAHFMVERWKLEKQGIITFGINILPDNYFIDGNAHGAEQEGVKEILDTLHLRKIDLSDYVVVLNVGGYIGESTRNEINYATKIGKKIIYLEN